MAKSIPKLAKVTIMSNPYSNQQYRTVGSSTLQGKLFGSFGAPAAGSSFGGGLFGQAPQSSNMQQLPQQQQQVQQLQQQQQQLQQQFQPQQQLPQAFSFGSAAGEHEQADDLFEEVASPGAFSEPTTTVSETPLAISYSVEGQSTVPSDGVSHQVSIAVLNFGAKVTHVAHPGMEPIVYLQVMYYLPRFCYRH